MLLERDLHTSVFEPATALLPCTFVAGCFQRNDGCGGAVSTGELERPTHHDCWRHVVTEDCIRPPRHTSRSFGETPNRRACTNNNRAPIHLQECQPCWTRAHLPGVNHG